jgi:formyltetrahydrofolate synthetase
LRGRPQNFAATEISSEAELLAPITGNMMRMSGLSKMPSTKKNQ